MASIGQALFPRSTERASIPAYHPRAVLDAAFDVASLPGRAYASLGRPSAESYSDAMARTGPTGAMPGAMYQSEGDEFADMVLRDPFLPLGAMLSAAAPIRALGQYGRAGVEGVFNAGGSMADQYAATGRAELAPSLLAGVAGAAPGILPAGRQTRAAMISPEERAANFRKWFGDSKVVDSEGRPLTMFHGTSSDADFSAFDQSKMDQNALFGPGVYTTASADIAGGAQDGAKGYAGKGAGQSPRIMPLTVKIESPFDADLFPDSPADIASEMDRVAQRLFDDATYNEIDFDLLDRIEMEQNVDNGQLFQLLARAFVSNKNANAAKVLQEMGYDGILHTGGLSTKWNPDVKTPHKVAIAFDPTQIKSATGNRGTFDPNDPNITHLTSAKPATRAATPLQTLGSRLSAQAKHAALREYLSDDRPQGDTHYTSRSRR